VSVLDGCDTLPQYRVLFHLDEGSAFRLKLALSNIQNLFTILGEKEVEIECIVNGAGVKLFQLPKDANHEGIEALVKRGVRFLICQNSLNVYHLTKDAMLDVVGFVPSGVGELVKKQAEGWAYIKP
jgi:intracellular sulfur oxidation DsrE/DsrF family protein